MSDDFKKIYEESLKEFKEGQIIKGKVLSVGPTGVLIDIGYKSEAIVPLIEFKDLAGVKAGDEVEVFFEAVENEEGRVVVSKERADKLKGWDFVATNCQEGSIVKGKVIGKTKGGLIVDIGIEAFLPASLIVMKGFPNLNQMIGQTYNFKIVKMNKQRKNVVVSRKDVLAQEREDIKNTF